MKILRIPSQFSFFSKPYQTIGFFKILKKFRVVYLKLSNCYIGEVWLKTVRAKF